MKKKKIVNCDGSELEVFFLADKDLPPNKHWKEMTGSNADEDVLAEHGQVPWGDYESESLYQKLNKKWLNKVKQLEQPESQIKIDDTIPSDFVNAPELRNGAIYKVADLNLVAKLVDKDVMGNLADTHEVNFNPLLKMKRHGTVFYVEKGSLMKATSLEVEQYLEE